MDFSLSNEEVAFRGQVRAWVSANVPCDYGSAGWPEPLEDRERYRVMREWTQKLYDGGWAGVTWPKEYGGRGATPVEQFLFLEEIATYRTPGPISVIGVGMVGPTIMAFGRGDQKEAHLRKILSGEQIWCQGFSEPDAGSDLAALKTTAVLDGDHYVVNGQKIWTSFGPIADWCLLQVRTDTAVAKHKGLSCLLVDMRSPGIEVRPIRQITGDAEFSELFITNLRVPRSNLLGQENDGWRVAISTLMHERVNIAALVYTQIRRDLREVVALTKRTQHRGRPLSAVPEVRQRLVRAYSVVESLRLSNLRMRAGTTAADDPGPIGSIFKLIWATTNQALLELPVDLLGPYAELLDGPDGGRAGSGLWLKRYFRSLGNSIEGGTSEILRNIIAERVLGLGRAPTRDTARVAK